MPAKRGVATDDRNRVAVQRAGLAFGRVRLICPLSFCPFEPSGLSIPVCLDMHVRPELTAGVLQVPRRR
jgi:hypothetical protein